MHWSLPMCHRLRGWWSWSSRRHACGVLGTLGSTASELRLWRRGRRRYKKEWWARRPIRIVWLDVVDSISFIRVYILIPTKQVAKAVNTTLTIKPCAPRADIKMPSLSRLKIASRMYNRSIVIRPCGFGGNEGMATPQKRRLPGGTV